MWDTPGEDAAREVAIAPPLRSHGLCTLECAHDEARLLPHAADGTRIHTALRLKLGKRPAIRHL